MLMLLQGVCEEVSSLSDDLRPFMHRDSQVVADDEMSLYFLKYTEGGAVHISLYSCSPYYCINDIVTVTFHLDPSDP